MGTYAFSVLKQFIIMFFIIITGVICYKAKLIERDANKKLSNLVLMLVNPMLIFVSYQREFEAGLLKGLLLTLLLSAVTHFIAILLSYVFIRKNKLDGSRVLERFAFIYSNVGFIGIPLVEGTFGREGVFYITACITMFNLFLWTHGVILMTGKSSIRSILKALLSPSVIAIFLGFFCFVTQISLPEIVIKPMEYIADMNTPLALLVAGATIAQNSLVKMLKDLRGYYITFLKQLILPVIVVLIFSRFPMPQIVFLTSALAASCPTAATINLFAIRYERDHLYAAQLFAFTTIFSIVSIPLIMLLAEFLIQ